METILNQFNNMLLQLINQNEQDYHFAVKPISSSVYVIDLNGKASSCSKSKFDEEHDIVLLEKDGKNEPQYITLYIKIEKGNVAMAYGTYQLCDSHEENLLKYERIPVLK